MILGCRTCCPRWVVLRLGSCWCSVALFLALQFIPVYQNTSNASTKTTAWNSPTAAVWLSFNLIGVGEGGQGVSGARRCLLIVWYSQSQLSGFLLRPQQPTEKQHPGPFREKPQSSGCGSAMGMVCRTSSSNCSALCRWISIQQGVSLMLCRG